MTENVGTTVVLANGVLQLQGAVTLFNLGDLINQLHAYGQTRVHTWDCRALTNTDSAAAAFLLAALKWRQQSAQPLQLVHSPQCLHDLLRLYNLETWVLWETINSP